MYSNTGTTLYVDNVNNTRMVLHADKIKKGNTGRVLLLR